MVKSGLKNYFVNLKYYFTPVGTLAIAMVLGLSILVPVAFNALSSMADKIIEILSSTEVSFTPIKDYIIEAVRSLDWHDPIEAFKIIFNREWLNGVISECFNLLSAELQPYSEQITAAVNAALATLKACVITFIVFAVIGLISGYFLTKFLIRRNIAKRNVRKFFLANLADALITTGLQILCVWLYTLWKPSVFISTLFSLFLFISATLFEAYIVHGYKKVDIKRVLNVKNGFKLLLSDIIIFYISLIFLVILVALTNVLAGLFMGFAFVEIAFIVINLNAEGYVLKLVSENNSADSDSKDNSADNCGNAVIPDEAEINEEQAAV